MLETLCKMPSLHMQLTPEQHRFELRWVHLYTIFFSINTVSVFFRPYDFLNNVLFSLVYFIVRI